MKEIIMRNAEGLPTSVNVVRFFRLNGIDYLIFSLNEIDDGGYVKLYVSKISDGVGKTIEDDVEWNLIKDTIKTIIKSNKDNLPLPITDLETNKINNIQIVDQKIFKLNDSLLQLLTLNKKETASDVTDYPGESQDILINVKPIDDSNLGSVAIPNQNLNTNIESNTFNHNPVMESAQFSNNLNTVEAIPTEYALDYKTLYDNELKKNTELTTQVEKYKNIIDNLRNLLNQNF